MPIIIIINLFIFRKAQHKYSTYEQAPFPEQGKTEFEKQNKNAFSCWQLFIYFSFKSKRLRC